MGVDGMPFNAPATRGRMDALLLRLRLGEARRVLDVGCGRGEMLARLAETTGCQGVGVDPDAAEIAIARARRVSKGTLAWHCAAFDDAPVGTGFDAAICVGATHAFGPPGEALSRTFAGLRDRLVDGGRLLVGEGYWKQPPPAPYLEATGFDPKELRTHAENLSLGEVAGLVPIHDEQSSDEEWDAFEGGFLAAAEKRVRDAPDDPDAVAKAEHWRGWNEAYRRWGRATLGFGFYVFEKPAPGIERPGPV